MCIFQYKSIWVIYNITHSQVQRYKIILLSNSFDSFHSPRLPSYCVKMRKVETINSGLDEARQLLATLKQCLSNSNRTDPKVDSVKCIVLPSKKVR